MRFSFDIKTKDKLEIAVPITYRSNILSFIKEATKQYIPDIFESYWGEQKKNIVKPFTFSLFIPGATLQGEGKQKELKSSTDYIKLFISSHDNALVLNLYNAFLNLSGKYSPFNFDTQFHHFSLIKKPILKTDTVFFKTFSPVVVRSIENGKGAGYLTPVDDNYIEGLKASIQNSAAHFLPDQKFSDDDIEIQCVHYKLNKVPLFGGVIPVTNGCFTISAPLALLKMIYDLGLGTKRSAGFGMVEVVG